MSNSLQRVAPANPKCSEWLATKPFVSPANWRRTRPRCSSCGSSTTPPSKPDPPSNCTILNQTSDSLSLECSEGFDGGLRQQFVMEVFDAASGRLVGNVTSRQPAFGVGGLDAGAGFKINVYAANRKGRSPVCYCKSPPCWAR
ncbi:unnamed protein product [Callosobruchus maculatus]|uniref:Fibronectin type-III domain-containing protein n=1 Tax=Callosobruchus maculatus TaxID=64391 RepID=A0A653D0L0_CALMS|nr:unnamed protein product [Callosobruchus maculatus]